MFLSVAFGRKGHRMKFAYHKALLLEGYDEKSEKYKAIRRFFDSESKRLAYDRRIREEKGIVFNSLTAFVGEESNSFDCFASDEDVEERVIHEIEIEEMHECLNRLRKEDRELLLGYFSGEHGAVARIARTRGVDSKCLYRRIPKLIAVMRSMMKERGYSF